jgi:transglutaminase-like putative cysteine protease
MALRVALNHKTAYQYDRAVSMSPHVVRLRPAPHCRTPIHAYSLKVEPKTHFVNWQQDPFGNFLARFVFPEKTREFSVEVDLVAEMTVINPFDFFLEESAQRAPFEYDDQSRRELLPYLEIRESGPKLMAWLSALDRSSKPTVDFLVALNMAVNKDVGYVIRRLLSRLSVVDGPGAAASGLRRAIRVGIPRATDGGRQAA